MYENIRKTLYGIALGTAFAIGPIQTTYAASSNAAAVAAGEEPSQPSDSKPKSGLAGKAEDLLGKDDTKVKSYVKNFVSGVAGGLIGAVQAIEEQVKLTPEWNSGTTFVASYFSEEGRRLNYINDHRKVLSAGDKETARLDRRIAELEGDTSQSTLQPAATTTPRTGNSTANPATAPKKKKKEENIFGQVDNL